MVTSKRLTSRCPICSQETAIPIAEFILNASERETTLLHGCVSCGSAHFKHNPRQGSTLAWHKKVFERNALWSERLYQTFLGMHVDISRVIDIGCGIGTLCSIFNSYQSQCLGYDTAVHLINWGKEQFGLNLFPKIFTADDLDAQQARATLVTCIMVLEHLPEPRDLAQEIAAYVKQTQALAYISVPFLNDYRFLDYDSADDRYNVFNDIGAHVTYFSDRGLKAMFNDYGLQHKATISGPWRGLLFGVSDKKDQG
jgi:SAM-dependent methyltransferase